MTRIDFHFNIPSKLAYTCRLLRKAHQAGNQLVVYSSDAALINQLDQALWTFSALDFLPHCRAGDALADATPIILTDAVCDTPHHDVLVNLDTEQPEFFSRFERVIEIVSTDEDDLIAGRRRWKFYKDRGYALNKFDRAGVNT